MKNQYFIALVALGALTVMQVTDKRFSLDVYPGKYVPIINVSYGPN